MIEKNNCQLKLLNLYFSNFTFNYKPKKGEQNINVGFKIKYLNLNEQNQIRVVVETNIVDDKKETIELNLETVAEFKINPSGDSAFDKEILTKNTVAIMFPYIRSQITLMTTQPKMIPIVLQPINVDKLVEDQLKKSQ